jgi:transposase InsO family protein
MRLQMNDERLQTLEQVKRFVEGSQPFEFEGVHTEEKYRWIEEVLRKFRYNRLKKEGKGLIRRYITTVTGYSRSQVARLIGKYQEAGKVEVKEYRRHCFPIKYSAAEVLLLARTDELHGWLSGPATKKILQREYEFYGDQRFKKICGISVAQIYNLRHSRSYKAKRYTRTRPVIARIGEREKPRPQGQPGYIRVDTVHQGDQEGRKGVYHINAVDEITQWEVVASLEGISENHLAGILDDILNQFPFQIRGFHSDNGGEFVNQTVAKLLNKLLIRFTRSRPRHSNDNGLVESKNGSVIRKNLGYVHIPQRCADLLNRYHRAYLNPYINFHRPCLFPIEEIDSKGKVKRKYPYDQINTPYEKLKTISNVANFLRPGVSLSMLDTITRQLSDNEFAERMVKARSNLFKQTHDRQQRLTFFDP